MQPKMPQRCCAAVLILLSWLQHCDTLKAVLIHAGTSQSHLLFGRKLAGHLAQSNHSVLMWSARAEQLADGRDKLPEGVEMYDVPIVSTAFELMTRRLFNTTNIFLETDLMNLWIDEWLVSCRRQNDDHNEKIAEIRRKRYDVALIHSFSFCPLILADRMGIENVVWEMAGTYITDNAARRHGISALPSYIPVWLSKNQDAMDFVGRLTNTLWYAMMTAGEWAPYSMYERECALHTAPPNYDRAHCMNELGPNVNGILVNGEKCLDFPRPTFHTVAFLGSAEKPKAKATKRLDDKWTKLLEDEGKIGTILVSFGSIVSTDYIPDATMSEMLSAFGHFSNYTVIWKITEIVPQSDHSHVHFTKWMPQEQILAHKRTSLFITHAGYNSLLEATSHGVPLLMIPFFADQNSNVNRALRLGLGLALDKSEISAPALVGKMQQLLDDNSIQSRGRQIASIYSDRIIEPVPYLDHNIRFLSKPHLNTVHNMAGIRRMSLCKYFCLDVILVWSGALTVTLYTIVKFALYALRRQLFR